ncbi:DUF1833 family protein, partial [Klebsiella pneumoniae]|uniref:DUF1833 family protein n=1 Tax=Klebsiella pneumoniae TaxID=573 RepID=UPI003F6260A5
MTILNRLYASSGPEEIIETLQISIGSAIHYLCPGYDNITATTENGYPVTSTACSLHIAFPARRADLQPDLQFSPRTIEGVLLTALLEPLSSSFPACLTPLHH